jgi:hypothetical protein
MNQLEKGGVLPVLVALPHTTINKLSTSRQGSETWRPSRSLPVLSKLMIVGGFTPFRGSPASAS